MNILITSAGQRVSLVRAFKNELKKCFADGKVYTVDLHPELSAACNVSDKYFKVKRVTDPEYIPELLNLCLENKITLVIPTIDTELKILADHKQLFSRAGIQVVVSSPEFIAQCRNKTRIHEFFLDRGIAIPRPVDKANPTFPLFIKPYDGSLSVDTFIILSHKELTEYHMSNERFLFMEYIDKREHDEYTIDMYFGKDNNVKCIVPRRRLHVRAGEINKGVTCRNSIIPFLKEKLGTIDGAVGCLTVQVFLNRLTKHIIAIEINPRFGGGYPLSYKAGANYPLWLIEEYLNNKKISYTDEWEENLLMLRYDDEVLVHDYNPQ